jgi:hypothetical protein
MSDVRVVDDALSSEEIQQLLDYMYVDDDRCDHRHDFRTKHPRWDLDPWPQHIIKNALDRLIGPQYHVQEIDAIVSQTPLSLHADAIADCREDLHFAVMFCLRINPQGQTVFFNNDWLGYGRTAYFTHSSWSPFAQKFKNKSGQWWQVDDIRTLLSKCESSPQDVTEIDVTAEFIGYLQQLVRKRSATWVPPQEREGECLAMAEPRINDYANQITNYDAQRKISVQIWQQFLQHQNIEDFHGLEFDQVVEHKPGRAVIWPRTKLHCSSHTHAVKEILTVMTEHPR